MIECLQARVSEKFETISTMSGQTNDIRIDHERLTYAKIEGPSVVLAYQADDKAHVSPLTPRLPFAS
jgi:hypothetical protein